MSPNPIAPLNFPYPFPAPWATAFGEDEFGLWMELTVQDVKQTLRWIEAGCFLMGSPFNEPKRYENEHQHSVTLTQGYWLADTACTQALWLSVMGDNPARFQDDTNNPVEQVSWNDVNAFLNILNQLIPELNARLPTEAEWEYACRAGTTTPYSFGDTINPKQVNYSGNGADEGLFHQKTVPVKSMPPNDWGLYEMHGNVWEWCHDWYGNYPNQSVTNPTGVTKGTSRVLRGGSWAINAPRSAYRSNDAPDSRYNSLGFRFALSQPPVDRNKSVRA